MEGNWDVPYKICPKCNHKNGPRTLKCKGECGHAFESASIRNPKSPKKPRNKVRKMVEVDYHKLEKGEKIKVIMGSGPYRINGDGERIPFGDYGELVFQYTVDNAGGFYIEYTGRPHITKQMIARIETVFRGKTIPGGFSMTEPIPGGFGEWIRDHTPYTPRHGSHIAAVLKEMGVIKESYGSKPIMLRF